MTTAAELMRDALATERIRQETKQQNIAAKQIAAANNVSTPTGQVSAPKADTSILKRQIGGVPLWAIGAVALGVGVIAWRRMR